MLVDCSKNLRNIRNLRRLQCFGDVDDGVLRNIRRLRCFEHADRIHPGNRIRLYCCLTCHCDVSKTLLASKSSKVTVVDVSETLQASSWRLYCFLTCHCDVSKTLLACNISKVTVVDVSEALQASNIYNISKFFLPIDRHGRRHPFTRDS